MKKNYTLIWDLDGTLFDSYKVIVSSTFMALEEIDIHIPEEEILHHAILYSLTDFIAKTAEKYHIDGKRLTDRCNEIRQDRIYEIPAVPHAKEIMQYLADHDVVNHVFTHRDQTAYSILENLGLRKYFTEIVTDMDGFAHKPDPDGVNYLINKYNLDRAYTYYVGDRKLDMGCGRNAGIGTILYLPASSVGKTSGLEDYVVSDLLEIKDILKFPIE